MKPNAISSIHRLQRNFVLLCRARGIDVLSRLCPPVAQIERLLAVDLIGGIFARLQATGLDVSLCLSHVLIPLLRPNIEINRWGRGLATKPLSRLRRGQVHVRLAIELVFLCLGLDGRVRTLSLFATLHPSEESVRRDIYRKTTTRRR